MSGQGAVWVEAGVIDKDLDGGFDGELFGKDGVFFDGEVTDDDHGEEEALLEVFIEFFGVDFFVTVEEFVDGV